MKTFKPFFACLLLFIVAGFIAAGQNPIYFSSGTFNPPDSWTQDSAIRMGSVANTNIQVSQANITGKCYFRFYSLLNGGTDYQSDVDTDIMISLATPFALQVTPTVAQAKSFYFTALNLTDNYVFKSNGGGAPGNTMCAVIRVQGPIQSVTGISQTPPGDVYAGEDVVIGATISDTFSPGQGVYLRYSTDYWNTSTVIEMTGSGTQYSAVIPGSVDSFGVNPNYYVFTSGDSLTIDPSDADLMTINLYNNNFVNFNYFVQCPFTLGDAQFEMAETDKARYNPSDSVHFTVTFNDTIPSASLNVAYWYLGDSIGASAYSFSNANAFNWTWLPPDTDYRGYFVRLYLLQGSSIIDSTSIAIDVSSDWKKYPRYGFLSAYPQTDSGYRQHIFTSLNRYHLNGLQFYDVNHQHNIPLAGSVANPDTVWNDIANRPTYLSTVLGYIGLAHSCNMNAMDYNLIYGAYQDSLAADGVLPQWGLYSDQQHQDQIIYTLPATWASNLAVENPGDTGWQNYLLANEQNLFEAIPYDGWHIDQLGSQGTVYDYNGAQVNLPTAFGSFIPLIKSTLNVDLVMNAVTNYGQPQIAATPVDFLYTEVWPPYTGYSDLVNLIDTNSILSNGALSTVLAAYMDYNISDTIGFFNTPAVLLTDAAIFAAGGDHIELGDHMLCNPYFPNNNLTMTCALQQNMIKYYDFMTGYENLLRDSISASSISLSTGGSTTLSSTAATGSVWYISRQKTNTQIFHFINLVNANTLSWNDPSDNQVQPTIQQNIPLSFTTTNYINKIYFVSPDRNNGLPIPVNYTNTGGTVSFSLPSLNYWSTIVVEYGQAPSGIKRLPEAGNITVYPNPFSGHVNFSFQSLSGSQVSITITDELGRTVSETGNYSINAASQTLTLPFASSAQGIYFWTAAITGPQGTQSREYGRLVH